MVLIGMGESSPTPYLWLAGTALIMGVGAGIAIPATNNALLQFSTSNVAAISGIRGMFKQIGAILTISITSAFVARSSHPGVELGHAFIVFAVLVFVIVMPLVFMVPERKGSW
jgi:MFS family permease